MTRIRPFPAYRPRADIAKALAAPPYDVLDSDEARAMAAGNEFSFLHCNKPEIDLPADIDLYDERVYQTGVKNLADFIAKGFLQREGAPCLYIYAQTMGGHKQYGIVGGASVQEYEQNLIKKHELTRKKKEEDRTKLTYMQNANIGPVFLTYRAQEAIDALVSGVVAGKSAAHDFTADDGIRHEVWVVDDAPTISALESAFAAVPCTYIADGHHRAASAYNVGKLKREECEKAGKAVTGEEDFNFFLAVFFPSNQLRIMDYNRVVKDLNGHTPESLLAALAPNYTVTPLGPSADPKPQARRHMSMFLNGQWYALEVKEGSFDASDPVKSLDVEILTDTVLSPVLGVGDLRSDDRIDFIGGIRGLGELKKRCEEGWAVAFALYPVSLDELMVIADAGQIMPPKSTWFEPKLRSGLLVRVFN